VCFLFESPHKRKRLPIPTLQNSSRLVSKVETPLANNGRSKGSLEPVFFARSVLDGQRSWRWPFHCNERAMKPQEGGIGIVFAGLWVTERRCKKSVDPRFSRSYLLRWLLLVLWKAFQLVHHVLISFLLVSSLDLDVLYPCPCKLAKLRDEDSRRPKCIPRTSIRIHSSFRGFTVNSLAEQR